MRWLVLGSRGMFGFDMVEFLQEKNESVEGFNSKQLDLTQSEEIIEQKIKDFDVVVNATGYTNVNLAETEVDEAFELNRDVPAKLARITARNNQKLIHISTDYVFDGRAHYAYLPTDAPGPLNVYGESKLAGENEVAKYNPEALILRTSWLYGPNGECFPKKIIRKLDEGKKFEVFDNQWGTPTSTWFLRKFCYQAIQKDFPGGIHHAVPRSKETWFGWAQDIAEDDRYQIDVRNLPDVGTAQRPFNSQLHPHDSVAISWKEDWEEIKHRFPRGK